MLKFHFGTVSVLWLGIALAASVSSQAAAQQKESQSLQIAIGSQIRVSAIAGDENKASVESFKEVDFTADGKRMFLETKRGVIPFDLGPELKERGKLVGKSTLDPTGRYLLITNNERASVHDAGDLAQVLRKLNLPKKRNRNQSASFFPDGEHVLFGKKIYSVDGNENDDRELTVDLSKENYPAPVASRDGKYVATSKSNLKVYFGRATLYDLDADQVIAQYDVADDHVRYVSLSPDGQHALIATPNTTLLWNIESGKIDRDFAIPGLPLISKDGKTVSIYGRKPPFVTRFELDSGKQIEQLNASSPMFSLKNLYRDNNAHLGNAVRLDASRQLIYDKEISSPPLLDLKDGERMGILTSRREFVSATAGRGITPSRSGARVVDFQGKELAKHKMPLGDVLAISPDGNSFVYAQYVHNQNSKKTTKPDQHLRLLLTKHDVMSGKKTGDLGKFPLGGWVEFSPDGDKIVVIPDVGFKDDRDPKLVILNAATGEIENEISTGPWNVPNVDFSADGRQILIAEGINADFWRSLGEWIQMEKMDPVPAKVAETTKLITDREAMTIWNLETGQRVCGLHGYPEYFIGSQFTADGTKLVSNTFREQLVHDARTGELLLKLSDAHLSDDVSHSIQLIRKEDKSKACRIWDLSELKTTHEFKIDPFSSVQLSKDSNFAIVIGSKQISVLNLLDDGSTEQAVEPVLVDSRPTHFKERPGYNQWVSTHLDGSVRFWDRELNELTRIYVFSEENKWLAIRPDGKFTGSDGIEDQLSWQVGNRLATKEQIAANRDSKVVTQSVEQGSIEGENSNTGG